MTGVAQSENPAKRPFRDAVAMTTGPAGADASERAVALAGVRSGKPMREIAVDLYGADAVAADWHPDGWMRAQVRRLVHRARTAAGAGSGDAATGSS